MERVKPGKYQHYKGRMYKVVCVAKHSEEEGEELVVYQQLYESDYPKGTCWARPKEMFMEEVEVEGKKMPRFRYLEE